MLKFSIIIPCYNSSSTILQSLHSIYSQQFPCEIEVILVDDGSTDDLKSVVKVYDAVIYIRKENGGVSSARNLGIKESTGDFLFFLDADDVFVDGLFLNVFNVISNDHELDFISWGFDITENNAVISSRVTTGYNGKKKSSEMLSNFLNKKSYQSIWSVCVRKNIIDTYYIWFNDEHKYAEDVEFLMKVMIHSSYGYYIEKPFSNYMVNNNGAMATIDFNSMMSIYELLNGFRCYAKNYKPEIVRDVDLYIGMSLINDIKNLILKKEIWSKYKIGVIMSNLHLISRCHFSYRTWQALVLSIVKLALFPISLMSSIRTLFFMFK